MLSIGDRVTKLCRFGTTDSESVPLLHVQEGGEERIPLEFLQSQRFGVILIIISAMCFGASASLVSLAGDLPTPLVVWSRFTGVFLCSVVCAVVSKVRLLDVQSKQILILRAIFGTISFACGTYAFQNLPVGEATVIISVAPVFVAIFSTCFLGDRMNCTTGILILMCLAGVVLIVVPDNLVPESTLPIPKLNIIASVVALGQAISRAISYIVIKKSDNKIHYITMLFWYSAFGMTLLSLFIGVMVLMVDAAGKSHEWIIRTVDNVDYAYLVGIGLLSFVAQITLTKATQTINTTLASVIRNADIIFTLIFQIVYYKEIPCWLQIIGIAIMLLSTVGVIVTKERERTLAAQRERDNDIQIGIGTIWYI